MNRVYDMTTRRELGAITRSEGLITCLQFYQHSHLFCGTEKGNILVWKVKHWEQLPTLLGHTGKVNSVSVHPNGNLALSTSQDKTLKLWDLTKGVVAHTNKLQFEADFVSWSQDGQHYLVVSDKRVVLYSAHGKKLRTMNEAKRILAALWLTPTEFATGGEDRVIHIWNIHSDDPQKTITGFSNRIKAIDMIPKPDGDVGQFPYIVSISSDEHIRIWDPDQSLDTPVNSVYTDTRLICLAVAPVPANSESSKKRKREDSEDADGEEAAHDSHYRKNQFKIVTHEEKPSQSNRSSNVVATKATKADGTLLKSILKKPKLAESDSPDPMPISSSTSASTDKFHNKSTVRSETRQSRQPQVQRKSKSKPSLDYLFE